MMKLFTEILSDQVSLFRQVHEELSGSGRISSEVYMPRPVDHGKVSVDKDGGRNAATVFSIFKATPFPTVGVISVKPSAIKAVGIKAFDEPTKRNKFHAYIDMCDLDLEGQRLASMRLSRRSQWEHPGSSPP